MLYICRMSYEDEVSKIFKDIAKPLEQLPKILESVMNNELQDLPEEQAKKIRDEVEALKPQEKVGELRQRMDEIMNRVK